MAGPDIRPYADSDEDAVLGLLAGSLGKVIDDRYRALFRWKHRDNPFGRSVIWLAVDDGAVVGVRSFLRWRFLDPDGRPVSAARAVDTATAPTHRRRGVFSALTVRALDELRALGVELVFNTPNDQSRPANLSSGWTVEGRIPVKVRPRSLGAVVRMVGARVPAEAWSLPIAVGQPVGSVADDLATPPSRPGGHLVTERSPEFLRWRYDGCAPVASQAVAVDDGAVLVRFRRRGGAVECTVGDVLGRPHPRAAGAAVRSAVRRAGADYAIATRATPVAGLLPAPGLGPVQTRRAVSDDPPTLPLALSLGDVELF